MQLYGVRDSCAKDLQKTLYAIAEMGYVGVEFHDTYGHDANTIRKYLDSAGLKCCGFHVRPFTKLLGYAFDETLEFNHIIGNPYIIIPGPMPDEYTSDMAAIQKTAEIISDMEDRARKSGISVGYHNESPEFTVMINGNILWDLLVKMLPEKIFFQLDTGNAAVGGADVIRCLDMCFDRLKTIHIKAFSKKQPNAIIGTDELPWNVIIDKISKRAITEWYVLEYESDLYEPMTAMKKSLENFQKLLKNTN
jgi:sugar phosphate isomerase/epimerase